MYGTLSDIAIAFIACALLVVMVDQITKFLQAIVHAIPGINDIKEWYIVYMMLWGIASAVCWQGRFDLFTYLHFTWHYTCEGYLLTGAMIAGGSSLLIKEFKVMGFFPSVISGISSMFGYGSNATTTLDDTVTPPTPPGEPEANQKGDD